MTKMNSATFPILTTERLTLRRLSINDHRDIFDLRSDQEINKFLDRQLCKTTEDAKNFINKVNENIEKGGTYYWAISFTDTKQLVGTICLFDFSSEKNSCEIGYELMVKFQGQGIMQEAAQTVIDFVFQTLKLKKILAFTHYENQNSTKLLLKFNFLKSIESDKENPNLTIFTLAQ
ncbi:MAG: GNAT family N-acetyltransferase [Flavobacterium sp.]|nr:GNAT family N-acetyltransferase [Flavobacterium sp.]